MNDSKVLKTQLKSSYRDNANYSHEIFVQLKQKKVMYY